MKTLLIKLPSRERPEKLFRILYQYQDLKRNGNTKFLITLDEDDRTMNNDQSKRILSMWGNVTVVYGTSKNKIDACNRDLNEYTEAWDVVLLASDDMVPQVEGYDDIILNDMADFFPNLDGVLHYNDGYTKENLNTLCIVGRKYYDRDKYLYHPEFISLWSDNFFQLMAETRKRSSYIDNCIIKHVHPMNDNSVKMDNSYKRTLAFYHEDKVTFERLKTEFLAGQVRKGKEKEVAV